MFAALNTIEVPIQALAAQMAAFERGDEHLRTSA
jgi:hypothetical protein